MNFVLEKDGNLIICDIVMMFKDDSNDINYVVYTDGTKDSDGELEMYASRYIKEKDNFILKPILNDYEWDLIDNMIESKRKENN